jgi:hypothetical protein
LRDDIIQEEVEEEVEEEEEEEEEEDEEEEEEGGALTVRVEVAGKCGLEEASLKLS